MTGVENGDKSDNMEGDSEEVRNDSDDDFMMMKLNFRIRVRLTTGSETLSGTSRRPCRT